MSATRTYNARTDLKDALPGPYYQLVFSLYYALKALRDGRHFDVSLELDGVGAYDDVVFKFYSDVGHQQLASEEYYQMKHSAAAAATNRTKDDISSAGDLSQEYQKVSISHSSFINKSESESIIPLELYKYFDDWFLFLRDKTKPVHCCYFTNRILTQRRTARRQAINFGDFTEVFLEDDQVSQRSFSSNFHKRGSGDPAFLKKVRKAIQDNSLVFKRELVDKWFRENKSGNPTYDKARKWYQDGGTQLDAGSDEVDTFLRDHYRMMFDQPNIDWYEEKIKQLLGKLPEDVFPGGTDVDAIFNAFIFEGSSWFRQGRISDLWANQTICEKLQEYHHRYVELQQSIGRSDFELKLILRRQLVLGEHIERRLEFNPVPELYFLYGEEGVGKATFIARWVDQQPKGSVVYCSSKTAFVENLEAVRTKSNVQTIVIDLGGELFDDELRAKIDSLGKKCIIIARDLPEGCDGIQLEALSADEISAYLQKVGKEDCVITIGLKNFPLGEVARSGKGGLYQQMRKPAGLLALCRMAREPEESPVLADAYPSEYGGPNFEPLPLKVKVKLPLYNLEGLLQAFDGAQCIELGSQYDSFKGIYTSKQGFLWIDGSEKELGQVNSFDGFLEQMSATDKASYKRGKCCLLIENGAMFSDGVIDELKCQRNIVFVSIIGVVGQADRRFNFQTLLDQQWLFKCYHSERKDLPEEDDFQYKGEHQLDDIVFAGLSPGAVLLADAGAGKTTSLRSLYNQALQGCSLSQYQHVIEVSLSEVVRQGLKNLHEVCEFYLSRTNDLVLSSIIKNDLMQGGVFFLVDALDELNMKEKEHLAMILRELREYKHFFCASRPVEQLFFSPKFEFCLLPFSLEQIRKFSENYFSRVEVKGVSSERRQAVVGRVTSIIFQNLSSYQADDGWKIAHLPLQCYLLCEARRPLFERLCLGEDVEVSDIVTQADLYQRFVISRLRQALFVQIDPSKVGAFEGDEQVCVSSHLFITTLSQAAYQQLIKNRQIYFVDDGFSNAIYRLGLIKEGEFIHRTYAEFFLAIFVVLKLKHNPIEASQFIEEYRYQAKFLVVFKFIAGIVSEGSLLVPGAGHCLRDFWEALLQKPRDCIGVVERELISVCYRHSNKNRLSEIFDGVSSEMFGVPDESEVTTPVSSVTSENSDEKIAESDDDSEVSADLGQSELTDEFAVPTDSKNCNDICSSISSWQPRDFTTRVQSEFIDWLWEKINEYRQDKRKHSIRLLKKSLEKHIELDSEAEGYYSSLCQFLELAIDNLNGEVSRIIFSRKLSLQKFEEVSGDIFEKIVVVLIQSHMEDNLAEWLVGQALSDDRVAFVLNKINEIDGGWVLQPYVNRLLQEKNSDWLRNFLQRESELHVACEQSLRFFALQYYRWDLDEYLSWMSTLNLESVDVQRSAIEMLKENQYFLERLPVVEREKFVECYKVFLSKLFEVLIERDSAEIKDYYSDISIIVDGLVEFGMSDGKFLRLRDQLLSLEEKFKSDWFYKVIAKCFHHFLCRFDDVVDAYLNKKKETKQFNYLIKDESRMAVIPQGYHQRMVNFCFANYLTFSEDKKRCASIVSALVNYSPEIVLREVLLAAPDQPSNGEEEKRVSCAVRFTKKYLAENSYAFVLEGGGPVIFTPSRKIRVEVSQAVQDRVDKLRSVTTLLSEGLREQQRPPSPTVFMLQSPFCLYATASVVSTLGESDESLVADSDTESEAGAEESKSAEPESERSRISSSTFSVS